MTPITVTRESLAIALELADNRHEGLLTPVHLEHVDIS